MSLRRNTYLPSRSTARQHKISAITSHHGRQLYWLIFQQNETIAPNPSHRPPHGPLLPPLPRPTREKNTLAGPVNRPGGPAVGQNVEGFLGRRRQKIAFLLRRASARLHPIISVTFGVGVGWTGEEGGLLGRRCRRHANTRMRRSCVRLRTRRSSRRWRTSRKT